MAHTANHRLSEIKSYFDNGDAHIGYRRLLDASIETQNLDLQQYEASRKAEYIVCNFVYDRRLHAPDKEMAYHA